MKISNLTFTLIVTAAGCMGTAYAAMPSHNHEISHAARAKHEGSGVLKAVDAAAGKVQLAHDRIPALGWPAMTMWFALREPLPREVKAGDSVRFELEQADAKSWVVTRIERVR